MQKNCIKWIAAKQEEQQRKASEKAESAAGPAVRAKLHSTRPTCDFNELQSTVCDHAWNDLLGRWEGVIPRAFVVRMLFTCTTSREFARENGYRNRYA